MARLAEFLASRRLPLFVHKAARAILHCRTAVLGGHVLACPDGHGEKYVYHSCGHRSCPRCAWAKTEQWLAKKRDQLLGCDHLHLTFTLPSELFYLWRYNYEALANLFFLSVKETLFLGDWFLHDEPGGSFSPVEEAHARRIVLRRLPLEGRYSIDGCPGVSAPDLINIHALRKSF